MTPHSHPLRWRRFARCSRAGICPPRRAGVERARGAWRPASGLAMLALLVRALLVLAMPDAWAQTKPVSEYELKAAFLPKFPLFVQWPASAFRSPGSPMVIGVLGNNPFGEHLENAVRGKLVSGRPLTVLNCRDAREAAACHVVFIPAGEAKLVEDALRELAGRSVLLVSDASGFASRGGMVGMVTANQKVALEVNREVMLRADLRMDPQLLRMVKVVGGTPSKPKP